MKINFRNKAARLKNRFEGYSCRRCPFGNLCSWSETIIDCVAKEWQISEESSDIFCL